MKRLLEFKVYDILQDKDNVKFLDKVKKETPELYTRFLNIIGNKGLDIAKQKYQEYDPEYAKLKREKEKEEILLRKKIGNKEREKQLDELYLEEYNTEINDIKKILSATLLKELDQNIQKNKSISDFLKFLEKNYKNDFAGLLKKPRGFGYNLKFNPKLLVDSIMYNYIDYEDNGEWDEKKLTTHIMSIHQHYDISTKKLIYNLYFNVPDDYDVNSLINSKPKEKEFIQYRNQYINNLGKSNIDKEELYKIIFEKLVIRLSDEHYDEWKMLHDANKYNL